ncbi:TetR/AcrR family transcriptional regulator [Pseudonocardia sp.]|uniref:TetR/AcrR family transcriptional regulator n=1 Tax=Pseudonocardia sp. TaxID=60912 RepID=UPI003D14C305
MTAVVAAGSALADEVGFAGVTMGLVAERAGVRTPSLYKHIDSLGALRRRIAMQAVRDVSAVLTRAAVGRSGPDAVRAIAAAYRRWALDHPGRYAATIHAPPGDDAEFQQVADDAVAVLFDAIAGFGLRGDRAIDAVRAIRAIIHGFAGLEVGGAFQMTRDVAGSYDFLVDTLIAGLQRVAPDADTPDAAGS